MADRLIGDLAHEYLTIKPIDDPNVLRRVVHLQEPTVHPGQLTATQR